MADLNYVMVSVVHEEVDWFPHRQHFHNCYEWANAPSGYELHRVIYHPEGDKHIHFGIYVEEPPPLLTIEEAAIAHADHCGKYMDDCPSFPGSYRALYDAVQRKKAE